MHHNMNSRQKNRPKMAPRVLPPLFSAHSVTQPTFSRFVNLFDYECSTVFQSVNCKKIIKNLLIIKSRKKSLCSVFWKNASSLCSLTLPWKKFSEIHHPQRSRSVANYQRMIFFTVQLHVLATFSLPLQLLFTLTPPQLYFYRNFQFLDFSNLTLFF